MARPPRCAPIAFILLCFFEVEIGEKSAVDVSLSLFRAIHRWFGFPFLLLLGPEAFFCLQRPLYHRVSFCHGDHFVALRSPFFCDRYKGRLHPRQCTFGTGFLPPFVERKILHSLRIPSSQGPFS